MMETCRECGRLCDTANMEQQFQDDSTYPDGWICFECCEEDDAQASEDYRNGQEDWAILHKEEEAREKCPELFGEK